jgi:hypothetical protein
LCFHYEWRVVHLEVPLDFYTSAHCVRTTKLLEQAKSGDEVQAIAISPL